MSYLDLLRLLLLSAIWGGSFIAMRVMVPGLGAFATAAGRALIAGLAFQLFFVLRRHDCNWRRFWKPYLVIGFLNSAFPFALFAFAADHLPAAYSAILNSTSPLFGALLDHFWLGEPLPPKRIGGLLLGFAGVTWIVTSGAPGSTGPAGSWFLPSILACLVAASCYAVSAVLIRKLPPGLEPMTISGTTQLAAGLMLLPFAALFPPPGPVTLALGIDLVLFALLCSGLAFLLYFRLIANIGATRALTVTFLMPVFGLLLGALVLGEPVTAGMLAGCVLVLAGTGLVLR